MELSKDLSYSREGKTEKKIERAFLVRKACFAQLQPTEKTKKWSLKFIETEQQGEEMHKKLVGLLYYEKEIPSSPSKVTVFIAVEGTNFLFILRDRHRLLSHAVFKLLIFIDIQ